jgi:EAL domain-containing protein (putative c-di-GMP-specific phosphodiesterase class I)
VETQAQLFALRARGCRRAQGFLFGRPMSPGALGAMLFKPRVIDEPVLDLPV